MQIRYNYKALFVHFVSKRSLYCYFPIEVSYKVLFIWNRFTHHKWNSSMKNEWKIGEETWKFFSHHLLFQYWHHGKETSCKKTVRQSWHKPKTMCSHFPPKKPVFFCQKDLTDLLLNTRQINHWEYITMSHDCKNIGGWESLAWTYFSFPSIFWYSHLQCWLVWKSCVTKVWKMALQFWC